MARQANGTYLQPANTAAVSGQTISSTAFNTLITDVGTEITNSVDRGGRSAMTAALPMGGQKITGMAEPTLSTDGATKNYVDTTTAAFFSTGDVKLTLKTTPDSGWLLFDDGTFGSASSGSSNSNNVVNLALFTLLFNSPFTDANCPLLTSGGGATTRAAQVSAAAAWAANCRMSLPKTLGRALGIAGAGSGLTSRVLGSSLGAETVTLGSANIPSLTSVNAAQAISVTSTNYLLGNTTTNTGSSPGGGTQLTAADPGSGAVIIKQISSGTNSISVTYANGSQTAVSIMQPISFLNAMVKV